MYWNEIIELGNEQSVEIDYELVETVVYRTVFANKLSIKQSEHYDANKLGLRPEIAFAVRVDEYDGESIVKWNDKVYYLIRTYDEQKNETVELYLSQRVDDRSEY
jgi:hypothetical protein